MAVRAAPDMIVVRAMIVPLTPALSRKRARGSIESLRDVHVKGN